MSATGNEACFVRMRGRPRLQLLVACGAAAGIASAYNVPIAGALFVAEIVLGTIAMESFGPLVFASVVSTLATRALLGGQPLFEIPHFELASYLELGPYMVLGMLMGALAPWFVRSLKTSERLFVGAVPALPLRLAAGGAIVGVFSIWVPQVWGNGYAAIDHTLTGDWLWTFVALVLGCKLLATFATVGSGAVGGVFTPTLFVGSSFGALFGALVHALMPADSASPSAYALVGMGSFLAGVTHAPLTAILMLFEMTRDYGIVLPLMLACVVAYYTSRAIEPSSLYASKLAGKAARTALPANATIEELVRPVKVTVRHDARFAELVSHFVEHRHNYAYVVDAEGRFLGAVGLHDIKGFMADPELSNLVIASEILDPEFPFLERDTPVGVALDRLLQHYGERLPVVDGHGGRMLVGTLSKRDVLLSVGMRR
ncbi:MAG: ClcB-like voltage-gated chloride channel protein [Planctomycetaceae bacterium]|nr:ClcB-like voltage-gated chloride channel protein [Planctomycetaceae bacterium]